MGSFPTPRKKFLEGKYLVLDKKQPVHSGPVSGRASKKNNKGIINYFRYTFRSDQNYRHYHRAVKRKLQPKAFANLIPLFFHLYF